MTWARWWTRSASATACAWPTKYRYRLDPLGGEHMADLYSSFDVLCNPAMARASGCRCSEAAACGVPAIVTDFTPMSEVCGGGLEGRL